MPDRRVHVVCAERLEQAQDLHVLAPSRPARTCLHQSAKRRERIGQLPSGERRCLVQRSDLALNEGQIVERVEDHVLAFVGAWVAGDDLGRIGRLSLHAVSPNPPDNDERLLMRTTP